MQRLQVKDLTLGICLKVWVETGPVKQKQLTQAFRNRMRVGT